MATIVWTTRAADDLEAIYDYIAQDSPAYAQYQIEQILLRIEQLEQFPESGRRLREFPYLPHREILIGNYRIIYRYTPHQDAAYLVTILHGSRLLGEVDILN